MTVRGEPFGTRREVRAGRLVKFVLVCIAANLLASCAAAGPGTPEAARVALVNHSSPADDLYNGQFCGGALVGPSVVATASHCVEGKRPGLIDVVVGAENLCKTAPIVGERLRVVEIISQSSSNPQISLLRLESHSDSGPLHIAEAGVGEELKFVGWGRTSDGGTPPCRTKNIILKRVGFEQCEMYLKPLDASDLSRDLFVCAIPRSQSSLNTCQGDSGSPVISFREGQWAVAGLTLGGATCEADSPGIYISAESIQAALKDITTSL